VLTSDSPSSSRALVSRVLDFEPRQTAARPVSRISPLRDNALQTSAQAWRNIGPLPSRCSLSRIASGPSLGLWRAVRGVPQGVLAGAKARSSRPGRKPSFCSPGSQVARRNISNAVQPQAWTALPQPTFGASKYVSATRTIHIG
jgi:hypothetical protein